MAIRTDYIAGEERLASQVNEENTQILQNKSDITDLDDTLNSPYISSASTGNITTGNNTNVAVPTGAKKAILNINFDATFNNEQRMQAVVYNVGLTSVVIQSEASSNTVVTITWSGSNVNFAVSGFGGPCAATVYFFKS